VAARDFAEKKTLDRLMMYERRIENSLYKTMSELHKLRLMRNDAAGSTCNVPARALKRTPCGVTTNAKQSQSADRPQGHPVETQNVASPPVGLATKEPTRADSDLPCKTKPIEPAGSVCSVPARAYPELAEGASEETPCGVTTNARQSQSADNAPVEPQHLASPPTRPATEESTRAARADSTPSCETKPIELVQSVCSVPARAAERSQLSVAGCQQAPEGPLRTGNRQLQEPPCAVTTSAKQSQSADHSPGQAGETQNVAALRGVVTDKARRAKQSQSTRPAAGVRIVPRPRVAFHTHNLVRSY
jgi:hypothetical protein